MGNKKAQVEDWFPTLFTIVVIVFVIIFFFRGVSEESIQISDVSGQIKEKIDANNNLGLYLKIPIENISYVSNVADLIAWSYFSDDYNALENITKDFFDPRYEPGQNSWAIQINIMPEGKMIKKIAGVGAAICEGWIETAILASTGHTCTAEETISSARIPNFNQSQYFIVYLKKYELI